MQRLQAARLPWPDETSAPHEPPRSSVMRPAKMVLGVSDGSSLVQPRCPLLLGLACGASARLQRSRQIVREAAKRKNAFGSRYTKMVAGDESIEDIYPKNVMGLATDAKAEEAERKAAIEYEAAALLRMRERRLRKPFAWREVEMRRAARKRARDAMKGPSPGTSASLEDSSGISASVEDDTDVDASTFVTSSGEDTTGASAGEGGRTEPVTSGGLADTVWKPARKPPGTAEVDAGQIALAEALIEDYARRRRCGSQQLVVLATALSTAGRHDDASILLRDARDFGIEREVLERRADVKQAAFLFEEVSMQLAEELRLDRQLFAAWRVLLELCAEDRLLRGRRAAVGCIADIAIDAAKPHVDPALQVEMLQGAVDACIDSKRLLKMDALPSDKFDELRLTLALSLQAAGYKQESRDLLTTLSKTARSQKRRQQADWCQEVQNVDVGDEPPAASVELRTLWENTALPDDRSSGSAGAGGGVPAEGGRGTSGQTFPAYAALGAFAVLVLPLGLVAALRFFSSP